ncbi:flippase [Candidatus Woesearchaeota archaeon]|nr:flippase [Candidatus Woesearchaeota archaeon]
MSKEKHQLLKQVVRGAGIIFVGTFLAYILNFVYRIVLTRYLGPSDYGLIALGQMVLSLGLIISLFGVKEGLMRYVAFYRGKADPSRIKGIFWAAVRIGFPIALVMTVLLVIFSKQIAIGWFHTEKFIPVLKIFALALPIYVLFRLVNSFFLAYKKPEYKQLVENIFTYAINLILVGIIVVLGGTVLQISWAYLISILAAVLLGFILLQWKVFPVFGMVHKTKYEYKKLIKFSAPLFFSGIFLNIMGWGDTFLLGIFKTAADVGVYNAVLPLMAILGVFLTAFSQIFYPIASESIGKNRHVWLGEVFAVIKRWIFVLTFPVFLIVLFFPSVVLKTLFGKAYVGGSAALVVLLVAYFINVINGPTDPVLKAFKKTKFIFCTNLVAVILNIVLNMILIPKYGIIGAAVATSTFVILREFVFFFKVRSMIGFSHDLKLYLKYVLSAVLPLCLSYAVLTKFFRPYSLLELLVTLALFCAVYLGLLLLLKSFNKEDLMILVAIERKSGLNLNFAKKIIKRFV